MTDKTYRIVPKGKTEPVFEVVGEISGRGNLHGRLAEDVQHNWFLGDEWDISEVKPPISKAELSELGNNALVVVSGDERGYTLYLGFWSNGGVYYTHEQFARILAPFPDAFIAYRGMDK